MSAQEQNDIHPKTAKDKAAKSEHNIVQFIKNIKVDAVANT
jgi:hypothetical protein